jgi:hypothetical protein
MKYLSKPLIVLTLINRAPLFAAAAPFLRLPALALLGES